jgi:hypothetical protein
MELTAEITKPRPAPVGVADLDFALTAQIVVAWAGESGEEKRLGWWRTDLASEFGGEDLFRRLLPNSWPWATLQAVREAARRKDAELRRKCPDPDHMVSLFALGFEIDERLDERLLDHKRSGVEPVRALPGLGAVVAPSWDASAFVRWAEAFGAVKFETELDARRIVGEVPADLRERVAKLASALVPVAPMYPLPYLRRPR